MFRYSESHKQKAIEMCLKEGPKKVREVLGVSSTTLYRWMKDKGINWKEYPDSPHLIPCLDGWQDIPSTPNEQEVIEDSTEDNSHENQALIEALLKKVEHLQRINAQLKKALLALLE